MNTRLSGLGGKKKGVKGSEQVNASDDKMATLTSASDANKATISANDVSAVCTDLGLSLRKDHLSEWHEIIASIQESIDVVSALPDYVPIVDLDQYPRKSVHRPDPKENDGNAWAWKVRIEGVNENGILHGTTFCLKDNIAVKDVPMLVGTDVFEGYVPNTDASM